MRGLYLLVLTGCGRWGFSGVPDANQPSDTRSQDSQTDAPADARPDVVLPPADALAPCTRLASTDDFNDGVRDSQWVLLQNNPLTVAETGGDLAVMLATAGGAHYGGYDSLASFDLRNHCMNISFVGVPTSEASVEMDFEARTSVGTVGFTYHQGMLDPFINTGTFVSQGAVPFSAATTKVVLLREDNGTLTWEVSPDGVSYTVIATAATPFDLSAFNVAIEAGTYASAPGPGTALYDDFDLP